MKCDNLFKCLETIGASIEPIWNGEWEGPIMFQDEKGYKRLILVEPHDHKLFGRWLKSNPDPKKQKVQAYARIVLVKMAKRKIDRKSF